MAKKKEEVVVNNEEVVTAEEVVNETVVDEAPVDTNAVQEEFDKSAYIMNLINEHRAENESWSYVWNGLDVKIKRNLNIYEMKILFDQIVSRCFSTENGEYQPEYKDFAERASVVALYTDLPLPAEVHDQYDLVSGTDIYHFVVGHIDNDQLYSIMEAADAKINELIEYKANDIVKKAEDAIAAVESLTKMFETTFDGVDAESISGVLKTISENGIDEEKIVNAIISKENNNE